VLQFRSPYKEKPSRKKGRVAEPEPKLLAGAGAGAGAGIKFRLPAPAPGETKSKRLFIQYGSGGQVTFKK
jgi:hypothetical protein